MASKLPKGWSVFDCAASKMVRHYQKPYRRAAKAMMLRAAKRARKEGYKAKVVRLNRHGMTVHCAIVKG